MITDCMKEQFYKAIKKLPPQYRQPQAIAQELRELAERGRRKDTYSSTDTDPIKQFLYIVQSMTSGAYGQSSDTFVFTLSDDGSKPVGYIQFWPLSERVLLMCEVYTIPKWRNKGVMKGYLKSILNACDETGIALVGIPYPFERGYNCDEDNTDDFGMSVSVCIDESIHVVKPPESIGKEETDKLREAYLKIGFSPFNWEDSEDGLKANMSYEWLREKCVVYLPNNSAWKESEMNDWFDQRLIA